MWLKVLKQLIDMLRRIKVENYAAAKNVEKDKCG